MSELRWIPVTERLPKNFENVLITIRRIYADGKEVVQDRTDVVCGYFQHWEVDKPDLRLWFYYDEDGEDYVDNEHRQIEDKSPGKEPYKTDMWILAWMPLPEPYKAESTATKEWGGAESTTFRTGTTASA